MMTKNRQHIGKIRLTTVVEIVLSSDNWECCPEIACHDPLAQKKRNLFQWSSSTAFSYMHPQGRVKQGNIREAKTKTCRLEIDKRLKRFHSPLENHSSSSASPKVESREKLRKKNAGERCQWDHGQISKKAERKRKTQETQRRKGGKAPD